MIGNQGRATGRGPAAGLDHVLIPVLDLDADALNFGHRYGLDVQPGGRHPGGGTANFLVPLGSTYLELIAVVDAGEAASSARSQLILEAARTGRPFATWAARTDSMADIREWLTESGWQLPPPEPGARMRPDGVRLEWTAQRLTDSTMPSVLPFLIEWRVPPGAHPAEAPANHLSGARDVAGLRFTAPDPDDAIARLEAILAGNVSFTVETGQREALVAIELDGPKGPILIP